MKSGVQPDFFYYSSFFPFFKVFQKFKIQQLGIKPSSFPTVDSIDAACTHESFSIINSIFPYFKLFFHFILVLLPCMEISLISCLCFYSLCRRGNNHFDVHFPRIVPVPFPSKDGKDAVREGRDGRKGVYFPARVGIFSFDKYYD